MIEEDLVTYLKTADALMALVGNGDSPLTCRIYPLVLPQSWTAPAIVYQLINSDRLFNLAGVAGRAEKLFQITISGSSYGQVKSVADALRSALNGYSGAMGASSVGYVKLESDIDDYLEDTRVWEIMADYTISYIES